MSVSTFRLLIVLENFQENTNVHIKYLSVYFFRTLINLYLIREHIQYSHLLSRWNEEKKVQKDYTTRSSSVNIDMSSLFKHLNR